MHEIENEQIVEKTLTPVNNKDSLFECLSFRRYVLFFLAGFLGLSVYMLLTTSIFTFFDSSFSLNNTQSYVQVMFLSYLLIFITVILCCFYETPILKNMLKNLKLSSTYTKGLAYGGILLLGSIFISNLMLNIGESLGIEASVNENETIIRDMIINYPFLTCLSVVILAPICEEFAYRVGLFGGLRKFGRPVAYVISACVFGLIHTNFEASNWVIELLNLPSYIFAGVFLCYAFEKNDSIEVAIIAHALNNFVSFLLTYLASNLV